MADPFTALASAMTILQLAKGCIKSAKLLYKFSRDNKIMLDEISQYSTDLDSHAITIELALLTLKQDCEMLANSHSLVLEFIKTHHLLDKLAERSEYIANNLQNARHWVVALKQHNKLYIITRWWLKKSDILAFKPDMDSIIGQLNLVISVVKWETCKDDKKKIERLRRTIKNQIKYIRMLEAKTETRPSAIGSHYPPPIIQDETLLELGESIALHGTVPKTPLLQSLSTANPSTRKSSSTPPLASSPPSSMPPASRRASPEPSPASSHTTLPLATQQGVSGYVVVRGKSPKFVTAMIDDDYKGNRISTAEARRLDLDVTPLPDDDGRWLLKESVANAVGRVVFRWRTIAAETAESRSRKVMCVVCEDSRLGLVFGRQFRQQTERRIP